MIHNYLLLLLFPSERYIDNHLRQYNLILKARGDCSFIGTWTRQTVTLMAVT